METWFILTALLVSTVTGHVDEWKLVHFSRSIQELRECFEETNLLEILNQHVNNKYLESYVFEELSGLLNKQTVPVKSIDSLANYYVKYVRTFKPTIGDDKTKRIREAIISTLHKCSDPEKSTNSGGRFDPPSFVQEIPELAELMNLFFVPMRNFFISFHPPTDPIKLFERALALIERGLRRFGSTEKLFNELLRMWNRRSRLFYDAGAPPFDYIQNEIRRSRVYSYYEPDSFTERRHNNYTLRDGPARNCDGIFEDTSYRAVDWRDFTSHVYSVPNLTLTARSRCYYEKHRNHFLRALFLHLELIDGGRIDENNEYSCEDTETYRSLLNILDKKVRFFRQYLRRRQREELSRGFANNSVQFSSLVKDLQEEELIDPVDLLMIFWHRVSAKDATTITSTTTPFNWNTSSTFGYEESKRGKGQVTRLPSGKFKPKNQQKSGNDEDSPRSPKELKFSETDDYDKYVVEQDNSDIDTMKSLKILRDMFSTLFRSQTGAQEISRCYEII